MHFLTDFLLTDLQSELEDNGIKPYRAKQIFSWIYQKGCASFDGMSDLPHELREFLKSRYAVTALSIIQKSPSARDRTGKYLFGTEDHQAIEGVYLTENDREIVCVSTQVGCPLECSFCASGRSPFLRNLTAGEMVSEVLLIKNDLKKARINNIVFMGMGEPFLNYENVIKTTDILRAHWGLGIGSRKITISTAGHIPGILRFAKENTQVRLSVSLHAITDELRNKLMPINRKYPVKELVAALKEYVRISQRKVSIVYTLIDGVNDSLENAKRLFHMIRDVTHTINLIPLNRTDEFPYQPPCREKQLAFQKILIDLGVRTTLRKEKGGDVNAACGQLRLRHLNK
jgi:23S rRNA (adenine2503-C2)-methyltransferase